LKNLSANKPSAFFPTSLKELNTLEWEYVDVILVTGDAYIDHPAFGAAVIGRTLEAEGLRVAIVPQPNWRDDLRDFKKMGAPRLFFGVTSGCMDSMVNHYTANKRLRSDDAYTPNGKAGFRPDYAITVYSRILKKLYPDTPVVLGGIEASLRRLTHYDYWSNTLKPSVLVDSCADILVYGMGEKPILEIARRIRDGKPYRDVPQTAYLTTIETENINNTTFLHAFEDCVKSKKKFAENFAIIEQEANKKQDVARLAERAGNHCVIVNPPYPAATEAELDASFDLPYTRLPHPRYDGKHLPAYEMIKFSVNIHRGCFGGCSFCTIAAHQGKQIVSRSEESVLREVEHLTHLPDFKGYLSDLGGPSANMYGMKGKDETLCNACKRNTCIYPVVCKNLHTDHSRLLALYHAVDAHPKIKKSFIGSGLRYDLFLNEKGFLDPASARYFSEVIAKHVSGRLKVAPEHTEPHVLQAMRKPSFKLFEQLKSAFDRETQRLGLRQQLVPYFISGHPACTEKDMQALAGKLQALRLQPEQVQDFTPTPMTHASAVFYSGIDPANGKKIYVARHAEEKIRQKKWFFTRNYK
jgi:uncharacterized radical SAM protein YgiQ